MTNNNKLRLYYEFIKRMMNEMYFEIEDEQLRYAIAHSTWKKINGDKKHVTETK